MPRGNGKTSLVAWLAARALTPGSDLFTPGAESHLCAASIGQARRSVFKQLRRMLGEGDGYRFAESPNACHVHHRATGTRVSVLAANGKTAQGLVGCPLVICDEPGAWDVAGGTLLHEAIQFAQGKPGSPLRALYVGTLAPALSGWWHELVEAGSTGSTHVTCYRGRSDGWDEWPTIRAANPLMSRFAESRAVMLEERDRARGDTRLKAAFLSYRLNVPTADEARVLLTVDDWKRIEARPVPEPEGRPVVGIDLGAGRAWSAAVATWRNGRTEALAVAPGIPSIRAQEKRDRVPRGTYQRLVDEGSLIVADGLRVPSPALLLEEAATLWGPRYVIADRFRLAELRDCVPAGVTVRPRTPRWSHSTEDIRALRAAAADGNLAVAPASRSLMEASLSVSRVRNDDAGNVRLEKSSNNVARDDVSAAWVLSAGGAARIRPPRPSAAVVCKAAA